jgi:hypothetical protein
MDRTARLTAQAEKLEADAARYLSLGADEVAADTLELARAYRTMVIEIGLSA